MAKQNYLDFIPALNPAFPFCQREAGLISITVRHKGFYHRIARTFFKTPAESEIALDKYGSFVWKQIDGNRTVFEIGTLLGEAFGSEADPLFPRLVRFISILRNNRFILLNRPRP